MDDLSKRLSVAEKLAVKAGEITLKYYCSPTLTHDRKGDNSPVTVADREAEQFLRAELIKAFPGDGVLGEEFGETAGTSGYRWILDPIDGTKSFIVGVPMYSVLIGLEIITGDGPVPAASGRNKDKQPKPGSESRRSVLGVIHIPATGETIAAATGLGAKYTDPSGNVRTARVSERTELADAVFLVTQMDRFEPRNVGEAFRHLIKSCYITRTWGDAYGYLLVATGRADIMIDPIMSAWDAAPLLTIMREAGGRFTDWSGRETIYSGEGIATNGKLHETILDLLKDAT